MGVSINRIMKLKDIFEFDLQSHGGGYPEKKKKDKTKLVSKLIRRKSDRNNPDRDSSDTEPKNKGDQNYDSDVPEIYDMNP